MGGGSLWSPRNEYRGAIWILSIPIDQCGQSTWLAVILTDCLIRSDTTVAAIESLTVKAGLLQILTSEEYMERI